MSRRRGKRDTRSYIASIERFNNWWRDHPEYKTNRNYIPLVPGLKKLKGRKTLTASEKRWVARVESMMRGKQNVFPIKTKDLKKARKAGAIIGRGIMGVQLRNTQPDATTSFDKEGHLVVRDAGRTFIHLPLPKDTPPDRIPEALEALAEYAFATYRPKAVGIWAAGGRIDEMKTKLRTLMTGVIKKFYHYQDQQEWVRGVAVLIDEAPYVPGSDIGEEDDETDEFEEYY